MHGHELVQYEISVQYSIGFGWLSGKIVSFNSETKEHLIKCDVDGEGGCLNLLPPKKDWKLIGLN